MRTSDVVIFLAPIVVGLGLPAIFNTRKYKQCGLKSPLQPPGYVFGIAWTLLYILYGAACVAAWLGANRKWTPGLIAAFVTLGLLSAWPIVFMNPNWCLPHYAFLAILAILGLVVGTVTLFVKHKLYLAASLLVPLVAWLFFATYLSYASIPGK
jgi:tryptophan-rich sensory protein